MPSPVDRLTLRRWKELKIVAFIVPLKFHRQFKAGSFYHSKFSPTGVADNTLLHAPIGCIQGQVVLLLNALIGVESSL